MKPQVPRIVSLFVAAFVLSTADAAITITLSSAVGGTVFSVTQDSPNPVMSFNAVTTGIVVGIPLPGAAFTQNLAVVDFSESFGSSLGTLSELNGAGSSLIVGFKFFYDSIYFPMLVLGDPIALPSGGTYQFSFSDEAASMVNFDFSNFVLGTYVNASPIFGQVTTIVVPEPSVNLLFVIGACAGLSFRRNRAVPSND